MRYKWQSFLNSYLVDFNATRAAKVAGYSEKTAYSIGQRLLKNVEIKQAIEDRMASKDEVVAGLTDIARGDMADLMDITTQGFTLQLMKKDEATGEMVVNPKTKLIKKIKQKTTIFIAKKENEEDREIVETEIELYSAHEAYRDLGKVHGIFIDKTELTGADGNPLRVLVEYVDSQIEITQT
jgi:phage terminase small subunit